MWLLCAKRVCIGLILGSRILDVCHGSKQVGMVSAANDACTDMKVVNSDCNAHLASPGGHELYQAICFAVVQYTRGVC